MPCHGMSYHTIPSLSATFGHLEKEKAEKEKAEMEIGFRVQGLGIRLKLSEDTMNPRVLKVDRLQ